MKEARTAAAAAATSSKIVGPKRIKVIVVQQKSQQALNLNPFRKRLREHFLYATLKSLLPPQYCHSTSQVGSNFKETSIQEEATELELKPYDEVFNKDNSDGEHSDTGHL